MIGTLRLQFNPLPKMIKLKVHFFSDQIFQMFTFFVSCLFTHCKKVNIFIIFCPQTTALFSVFTAVIVILFSGQTNLMLFTFFVSCLFTLCKKVNIFFKNSSQIALFRNLQQRHCADAQSAKSWNKFQIQMFVWVVARLPQSLKSTFFEIFLHSLCKALGTLFKKC